MRAGGQANEKQLGGAVRLRILGAAGEVTGSMHLLEANGRRLLLDCGMVQGKRSEAYDRNQHLPLPPASIDACVLSHAHLDHCGNLPQLVKSALVGPIYATPATRDLTALMLMDSGHIQESDIAHVNKRRLRRGEPPFRPLYTMADAAATMEHFVGMSYGKPFEAAPGITVHFLDAGHILGSAIVVLDVEEGRTRQRLVFSGDLGRRGAPILRDPSTVADANVVLMESTYGGRRHEPFENARRLLLQTVKETCIDRGGWLLIPSFALGRVQELVYHLDQLRESGELPLVDVFVDSPLAVSLTGVFRMHPECYDHAMLTALRHERDGDPLGFDRLRYTRTAEESKALNERQDPAVVIAASGMCESGRILHHLARRIGDPRTTVLFVGYQARDTLGRRLAEGAKQVRIYGEEYDVRARIVVADGYSAHADHAELLDWARALGDQGAVRQFILVHGEPDAMTALAQGLAEQGARRVATPARGDTFDLG